MVVERDGGRRPDCRFPRRRTPEGFAVVVTGGDAAESGVDVAVAVEQFGGKDRGVGHLERPVVREFPDGISGLEVERRNQNLLAPDAEDHLLTVD